MKERQSTGPKEKRQGREGPEPDVWLRKKKPRHLLRKGGNETRQDMFFLRKKNRKDEVKRVSARRKR